MVPFPRIVSLLLRSTEAITTYKEKRNAGGHGDATSSQVSSQADLEENWTYMIVVDK